MAKTIATILGAGFLLIGIIGFVMPEAIGMHLTLAHNIIHLVTGAVSLWIGLKGTIAAARTFCMVFGLVYSALGIIGYVIGEEPGDMWELIPGQLMWGAPDHGVHILLGLIYLIGGLATRRTAVDTSRTATTTGARV